MKRTKILLSLALAWTLTACGPDKKAKANTPAAPGAETAQPNSGIGDLAAPVTAPMKARDRLMHDMRQQNVKAQQRRRAMDSVIDPNR